MATTYTAPVDEPQCTGEGITYTKERGARLWALEVPFPGRTPMRCTIRAKSQRQALQFAAARHPAADPDGIRVLSKDEARELIYVEPH